jgi:lipopolysaccharide transport system ATP-binding protein
MSSSDRAGSLAGTDIAIRVRGVGKSYHVYSRPSDRLMQMIWRNQRFYELATVLEGVDFEVRQGQAVGIVGRNGAGKSTLLQIIAGTLQPSSGSVEVNGRVAPLIELGAGFNPEFSGHDNLMVYGQLLGMDEAEIERKFDDIVRFADIGEYLERPVKTYSSGMYARLAFAVAMHLDPKILIVDEILAVGDAPFQRKCMNRFYEIKETGCTILIVAHDQYLVRSLCDQALYLKAGRLAGFGAASAITAQYEQDIEMPASHLAAATASPAPAGTEAGAVEAPAIVPAPADPSMDKLFKIVDVAFLSDDGAPVEILKSGDGAHLRMRFKALTDDLPDAISFVFNLYRHDGVYVCGSTTLMDGLAAHAAAPAGEVTVSFPSMPLLSGRYIWRVAINDHGGLLVHSEAKGVCPFRVIDDFRSVGIVHLERSWAVELADGVGRAKSVA